MAKSKKNKEEYSEEDVEKMGKAQESIELEIQKLNTLKKEWQDLIKQKEQGLEVDEKRLELLEQENKSLEEVDKKVKKLSGDWNKIEKKVETSKESMMDGFESIFGSGFGKLAKAFKGGPKKMNEQGEITTPISDLKKGFSEFTKDMREIFGKASKSMEDAAEKAAESKQPTTNIPPATTPPPAAQSTPTPETTIKTPRIARRSNRGRVSRRARAGVATPSAVTGGAVPPPTTAQPASQTSISDVADNLRGRRRGRGGAQQRPTVQPASPAAPAPPTAAPPPAAPPPPTRTAVPGPAGGGGGGGFGKAMGNMKNVASGAIKGLGGAGKALASLGSKAIPVVGQVMAVVDAVKMIGGKFKDGTAATWAFAVGLDGMGESLNRLTTEFRDRAVEQKIVEPVRQKQQDEQDMLGYQQSLRQDKLKYNQDIERENLQIKQGYAKEDLQFQQGLTKDRISLERQKEDDAVNFGFSLVEDRMGLEKSMQEDMINYQYSLQEDKMNLAHQEAMKNMQAEFNLRKSFFMAGMQDQQKLIGVSARALEAAGSSGQEVIQTASGLATSMGLGLNQGIKLGTTVSLISKRLGIGAEEVGKIGEAFRLIGGLSAEQALNLQTSTAAMAKANGLNPQAVMKEMAAATEDAYSYNIKSAEALAEQVTAVTAIGASFSKIAKAGKNMVMNYKDSIKAEMQLSTLLGEQVDLSEARAAFASGDVAGGTAALQAQLGDMDIASMDMFQKEALSQALGGMDLGEIMKVGGGKDGEGFGPEKNMADATAKFSGAVSQFKTDATQIGKNIANGALAMDVSQTRAEQAAEQAHRLKMLQFEQQKRADMLVFEQQWKMKEMLFEQDKREYMMGIEQKRRYDDMMLERDMRLETVELERLQKLETLTQEQKFRQQDLMLRAQERREQSDLRYKQAVEMSDTLKKAEAYKSAYNRYLGDYNLNVQSTTQTAGMDTFKGFGQEQALQNAGVNLNMAGVKDVKQQDKEYWKEQGTLSYLDRKMHQFTGGVIVSDMFGVAPGQQQDMNTITQYQGNIGTGGTYANTKPGAGGYQTGKAGTYNMSASMPYQMPAAGTMPYQMPGSMPYQMPAAGSIPNMASIPNLTPTGAGAGMPYNASMMGSMNYGIGSWNKISGQTFDIPNLVGGKMPAGANVPGAIKLPELQPYGMPQQTAPAPTPAPVKPAESKGFWASLMDGLLGGKKEAPATPQPMMMQQPQQQQQQMPAGPLFSKSNPGYVIMVNEPVAQPQMAQPGQMPPQPPGMMEVGMAALNPFAGVKSLFSSLFGGGSKETTQPAAPAGPLFSKSNPGYVIVTNEEATKEKSGITGALDALNPFSGMKSMFSGFFGGGSSQPAAPAPAADAGILGGVKSFFSGLFGGGSSSQSSTTAPAPSMVPAAAPPGPSMTETILTTIQTQADIRGQLMYSSMLAMQASLNTIASSGQSSSSTSPFQEKLFEKLVYMSGNLEKILTRTDKTAAYMYVVSSDIKTSLKNQTTLNTNTSELIRLNKNIQNLVDAMLTNNQNEGTITLSIDGKQVSRVIKRREDNERVTNPETED